MAAKIGTEHFAANMPEYCGLMSRLHASHLLGQGFANVKVYRPQ
jgi:hypothetical protein